MNILQCVTASKKLTYKKLQADFFWKTVPKYKKLISLKYKCTVSYKFKMGQFERKIISFEVTVTEIFKQNKHKLSETFSGAKKLSIWSILSISLINM